MPVVLVAAVVVTPVVAASVMIVAPGLPAGSTTRGLHDAVGVLSERCVGFVRADSADSYQHHPRKRLERR